MAQCVVTATCRMTNTMKQEVFRIALTVLALVLLSCLVSIMAVFMGGGQAGTDLHSLLALQIAVIPVAFMTVVVCVYLAVHKDGWKPGLSRFWDAIPQWLVFILFLLTLLGICGEVALVVKARLTESPGSWHEHVPLVCMLFCSAAFLALYSRMQTASGRTTAMSGRW